MSRFIALTLTVLMLGTGLRADEELKAADLARAMGVDWWVIELPADQGDTMMLGFCLVFADGRKEGLGTMGGFRAGERVRAFCWPSGEKGKMDLSLLSDAGRSTTTLVPWPVVRISTYAVAVGKTAKPGDLLWKGSTTKEVIADQTLREGDCGLVVLVKREFVAPPEPGEDTITISADGALTLNGQPVALPALAAALTKEKVLIRATSSVPVPHYIAVIKEVRKSGQAKVTLVTIPEE